VSRNERAPRHWDRHVRLPTLINITIKKRAARTAGTLHARGWTPAGTLRGTQNRRAQSERCRGLRSFSRTPKNNDDSDSRSSFPEKPRFSLAFLLAIRGFYQSRSYKHRLIKRSLTNSIFHLAFFFFLLSYPGRAIVRGKLRLMNEYLWAARAAVILMPLSPPFYLSPCRCLSQLLH